MAYSIPRRKEPKQPDILEMSNDEIPESFEFDEDD